MTTLQQAPDPGTFATIEQAQEAKAVAEASARRRRLLLWSAPVVAIVGLIALYLLTITLLVVLGERSYASQSYPSAVRQFSMVQSVNVVESWKPYYNSGTARYSSGAFFTASQELTEALERVPRSEEGEPRGVYECMVAINLSLSYEGMGDEAARAADTAMALSYYEQALAVAEGCGSGGGGGDSEQEQEQESQADENEQRQQDKQDEQEQEQQQQQQEQQQGGGSEGEEESQGGGEGEDESEGGEGGQDPSEQPTTSEQQQELEQRNQDAQDQAEQEREESEGGSGGGQGW